MSNITYDYINDYIREITPESLGILGDRKRRKETDLPIIQKRSS